jgi:ATP-dependent RNA helicase DDX24/MAK5
LLSGCRQWLDFHCVLIAGQIAEEEEHVSEEESESEEEETEDSGEISCVKVEKSKFEGPTAMKMGRLHALILTPTRELAVQVKNHLVAVTKYCDIRVCH